jgi:hypothetical protein
MAALRFRSLKRISRVTSSTISPKEYRGSAARAPRDRAGVEVPRPISDPDLHDRAQDHAADLAVRISFEGAPQHLISSAADDFSNPPLTEFTLSRSAHLAL